MIKLYPKTNVSGTGLAYQMSSYVMMRSLEKESGLEWKINPDSFLALRHTFDNLNISIDSEEIEPSNVLEFNVVEGFESILSQLKDDTMLFGYSTPRNILCPNRDVFEDVKKEFIFRPEVVEKCQQFRSQFGSEVIALHIRRGDFLDPVNGMYTCSSDYYQNALELLPKDIPVLVFSNDKEDVFNILPESSRFIMITDLYHNNEVIDCALGQKIDYLVDINAKLRFDYTTTIKDLIRQTLIEKTYNQESYQDEDYIRLGKSMIRELHSKYRNKIRNNLYNHSFDLCLMTMCDYFITANSTFSLWGSELALNAQKVIYPMHWLKVDEEVCDYNQTLISAPEFYDKPNYIGLKNS